jgi:Fur family transcriptional regulator, ferric uptake regulator
MLYKSENIYSTLPFPEVSINPIPDKRTAMHTPKDLQKAGLKITLPRLKVLNLFESSENHHLSAEDVYKLLLASGEDVSLATVYRVLTQFELSGLLMRHELNHGEHHDHIVCMQCGHVEEFYDPAIETRQKKIASEHGFTIHDHSLYIYGDCTKQNCPNKRQD